VKFNEDTFRWLEDEAGLLFRAKKELGEKYITIPITEPMLIRAVNRRKIKGVTNLTVRLIKDKIVVSGAAKKLRITINFCIEFQPLKAKNRILSLKLVGTKPFNQEWIINKVLNKYPYFHYQKGIIQIDLNQFEKAKSIRFGNVKHFEVRDEKLWIGIGI
jgi:S-adenosylmethionine synthetase